MPTLAWLREEFSYGYDSGNVLSLIPNLTRYREERKIGGSYRKVFKQGLEPYLKSDSRVLELGPGKGSWTRAILTRVSRGEVHTVDFQDITRWLDPARYGDRLVCHRATDNSMSGPPDYYFDVFWSFGVLCHNNQSSIEQILASALAKMKAGGLAVHQYGDWNKLSAYGWDRGRIPVEFQSKPDEEIWWPRNDAASMVRIASKVGWTVVTADLSLVKRDGIVVLKAPG